METVAKGLKYLGNVYEYSHAKGNILVYVNQPCYYYEDWQEDGGILVVKYRPECKNGKYLVLHCMRVNLRGGGITHINISKENKIAEPYNKK